MLRNTEIIDKTFDERIDEGISKIPVYSREWTNFNASDPGITILDNLSLFETLQQEHVNEMPPEVTMALLKMTGFTPAKGRCARTLISPKDLEGEFELPKGCRFHVGDVIFENPKKQTISKDGLIGICGCMNDEFYDYSDILDKDLNLPAHIFGHAPQAGTSVYFIFDHLPKPGEELICYAECIKEPLRNDFTDKDRDLFCQLDWEVLCEDGFESVNYKDLTGGFVTSGELHIRMPQSEAAVFTQAHEALATIPEGYCIRATLKRAEYDVPPAIVRLFSGLFEVVQMDSGSFLISDNKPSGTDVPCDLLTKRYVSVFVREEKGSSYRRYDEAPEGTAEGRYYRVEYGQDTDRVVFDKKMYGYGPEKGRGAVKIVCYTQEIANNFRIGTVIGFDKETFELPGRNIVAESFSIIAKRIDENGEPYYDFVRPGHNGDGEFFYLINEREGKIVIEYAGDFIGAELFVGGFAIYSGEKGNIRSNVTLKSDDVLKNVLFTNPTRGHGGRYAESLRSVRMRYKADIETPFAAVTSSDYETIVKTTPGLCISKVRAIMDKARNQVDVVVLPAIVDKNPYPKLSSDYRKRIMERLDERRLLTDRISLENPQYIKVNVKTIVHVSNNTKENYEAVEKCIKDCLDYVRNDAKFGQTLKYDGVFNSIEALPFVDYVYSLTMRPSSLQFAMLDDIDIKPHYSGLIIPGNIDIELMINQK